MMNKIFEYLRQTKKKKVDTLVKWKNWAAKRLRAKNILVDLNICAYGRTHLIKKVVPFGGGFVVWSGACDGCKLGLAIQNSYSRYKISPPKLHCIFLKSALLTQQKVEVGQLVKIG